MTALQRVVFPLILLKFCLTFQASQSQQQNLCVQSTSNSTPSLECNTLDWYSDNSAATFISNRKLLFQEGTHSLKKFLHIVNCHNLTITGSGNALHRSDGLPLPTSIIKCHREYDSGFLISNSSNICIHNLEFRFCSGHYTLTKRYNFTGSLVFLSVQGICLSQILVNKSMGYGLHAVNIFGKNKIIDSAFLHASQHHDPTLRYSGNANFFYNKDINTSLVVDSSWFMYGNNYNEASGFKLVIYHTRIQVSLKNITAQGNAGKYGGNLAISVSKTVDSRIVIDKSCIVDGRADKGAGLRFWYKQSPSMKTMTANEVQDILSIYDTLFQNNSAQVTAGAMFVAYEMRNSTFLDSLVRQILITGCNFSKNIGNGAAMEIVQLTGYRIPNFQTAINACNFEDNSNPFRYIGPILDFIAVEVSMTNCTFARSNNTVISLRNSYLWLFGEIHFENNSATIGGALKLCDTSLVFANMETMVSFVNNSAKKGGAIYVQQQCMDTRPLCFLQPSVPVGVPLEDVIKTIKFEFINNTASIAGDILYGGNIDQCSTVGVYRWNATEWRKDYRYNAEIFDEIFKYQHPHGPSLISSDPRGVCFCHRPEFQRYNHKQTCLASIDPLIRYPGEKVTVSVITVGQMNGSTLGIITTSLVNDDENHTLVRLDNPVLSASCINLSFIVKSNREIAHITFKPVILEVLTIYGTIFPNLTVHLHQCPVGFELSDKPPYECVCNPILSKFFVDAPEVKCNISSNTVSFQQRRMWIGCLDKETCKDIIVAPNCDYYCRSATNESHNKIIEISVMDPDSQCSPGHTGILCGACKPGYSRILGGALECHEGCTNCNLPFLIPFFLALNILLVMFIMFLNITVTEGTINGLLVYAMVVQTRRTYFPDNPSGYGRVCWIFITLINLSFGSKMCFFKGLDGYQLIWALFIQAFYFLFILMLIIYLSRRFIFFTRLMRRNIINVLATLTVMLYTNLLFAMLNTFKYAILHVSASNGTQYSKVAWYYDANIPYFGLKHSLLFAVALLCSVAMMFFMFSLLFIQCLQKKSDYHCLHWVDRLRPFYEAYTGPCRDNYRFWPGFLLFMRTGVYILNSLIPAFTDEFFQIKMLVTAAIFILIMSLACIFPQGIYKKWPLNILEFSFFLNLCITSAFIGLNSNKHQTTAALYTSVSVAAFTTFGILLYHIYAQIKETCIWKKLIPWCLVQASSIKRVHRRPAETKEVDNDDENASLLPQVMPTVVDIDSVH